jgi:hypothetical protein
VYSRKSLNIYWSERSTLDIKIINLINILVILGLTYDNAFNFYPTIDLLPYLVLLKEKKKSLLLKGYSRGWPSLLLEKHDVTLIFFNFFYNIAGERDRDLTCSINE